MNNIVLSLYDYTGETMRPWAVAGYECYCFDIQHPPEGVVEHFPSGGSLNFERRDLWRRDNVMALAERFAGLVVFMASFPVCTDMAVSGAAWFAGKAKADPDFQIKASDYAKWCGDLGDALGCPWFVENPVSVLSTFWRKPDHIFNPHEYGGYIPEAEASHPRWPEHIAPRDAYPKKTCLWSGGGFEMPNKRPVYCPKGVSTQYLKLGGKTDKTKNIRSATPRGFARANFLANEPRRPIRQWPGVASQDKYKFIDLFAGIGGFHYAFARHGAECVFASEWNKHARATYEANHRASAADMFDRRNFAGDITEVVPSTIPDFDVACAGFPCQPFSNAGHGRGFDDVRGTHFFNVVNIIGAKRPAAFFLENVRGLYKHNEGKTFATIKDVIEKRLGYSLHHKVVMASDYGLPQLRPRLMLVGFRDPETPFSFPDPVPLKYTMSDIFEGDCPRDVGFTLRCGGRGSGLGDRHNWDSYLVDGAERRLTVREAAMLQGLPSSHVFPVSDTQAFKQLGNSVAVDAIALIAKEVLAGVAFQNVAATALAAE